ncbi:MAG: hypothetical protein VKK97_08755 [Synechococcaceae cyanobacterium]|nr:hypothetical protein [Synechococcaceae cyanobacterium]
MKSSSILAHRGWFLEPSEKNTEVAFQRAISHGFGIETDIRDHNGHLVIAHDPPRDSPPPLTLEWFFALIQSSGSQGRIALNIKADGLMPMLRATQEAAGLGEDQAFVFDMSVPDAISFLGSKIHSYSRISEYEPTPPFSDQIQGVWVDNFTGTFPQVSRAAELLEQGIRAAIVSPELHRRDPVPLWNDILDSGIHAHPLFELCTDLPSQAAEMFLTP